MALYAEIIVPLPLPVTFTYRVPPELENIVRINFRVVVPFGKKKFYTAIVKSLSHVYKGNYEVKDIAWCPDTSPILRRPQMQLWEWMSEYYMCAIGDVFKAALPSGLKIDSQTIVEPNSAQIDSLAEDTTSQMVEIWERLKKMGKATVTDLESNVGGNIMESVYALVGKGLVSIRENHSERFHPKTEEYYIIMIPRNAPDVLAKIFSSMRSERNQRLLMLLLHNSNFTRVGTELRAVSRDVLKDEESFDRSVLKNFEKKGYIRIERREISRFKWNNAPLKPLPVLTTAQDRVLKEIHSQFNDKNIVLLHGVTSSGKTEIYIHLIDFILKKREQVLFLVPEIALTTQLTRRLQGVFGNKVIIYHSRFTDAERAEIWHRLLHTEEPLVIIGARSSVFLPFSKLGLVIVDEEHEQSYKQFDPAPRYNGRDVATVLSRLHGAKTLLGSATPSVESYAKAKDGRYGLVTLKERFEGVKMPTIEIVDMKRARLKGEVNQSLSARTVEVTREALRNGEQAIIFHNRRGYSPIAHCKSCEFIPKCTDCDVSLSYHKRIDRLVCHYCGKEYILPTDCPVCKQPSMEVVGFGTERVEDSVAETFSEAKILRMDLDTTRNKEDYSLIIDNFSEHKADILVGTQMVTKGLDFGKVSTVTVLNADKIMNYPDFRATERAFDMLEQVSGRAGRRSEIPGRVIIQTTQPDHPILDFVLNHDYAGFFEYEMSERKAFGYPPFTRLIYIYLKHKDVSLCEDTSNNLSQLLRTKLGNRVFGPQEPIVNRIKTYYIRRIMIKIEPEVSVSQVKNIIQESVRDILIQKPYRGTDIYFDVDPL